MCVIVNGEEKIKAEADRNFIANMKNPAFVTAFVLADAGINQPPCFCCLQQIQGTCPYPVSELGCRDYVLYSESPEKVVHKLLNRIEEMRKQSRQQLAA